MGNLFLLNPIFTKIADKNPKNPIVEYAFITRAVFFLMSLLLAPMMFFSVIVPSMGDRFKDALEESLSA